MGIHIITTSINIAISAITKSSTNVTQVIGTLKNVPRHAHWIFSPLRSFKYTPAAPTNIIIAIKIFTKIGKILSKSNTPNPSSINGYAKAYAFDLDAITSYPA
ncbi:MAG TPA: hypothetical protein EYG72_02200 [Candidatus Pacebacteria bacterium]|nr:hypothetical protein [Candidatus Paceibacterota bacterium]